MFDIYFKEHVVKMQSVMADDLSQIEDDFLLELCMQVLKFGQPEKVASQLEAVVNSCKSAGFKVNNRHLCSELAQLYGKKLNRWTRAYTMSLRALDVDNASKALVQVMK